MIQKIINIQENQEKIIKLMANNLGMSEEELLMRAIDDFITLNKPTEALESFLQRAQKISQESNLPEEYSFKRDELYEEVRG